MQAKARKARHPHRLSRFGRFMVANGIECGVLSALSGISARQIVRLRYGRAVPKLDVVANLRIACATLVGRRVYVSEMFAIGEDDVLSAIDVLIGILRDARCGGPDVMA